VTVILASHGYPHAPRKSDVITGLVRTGSSRGPWRASRSFTRHRARRERALHHRRGRVLAVTGVAETLVERAVALRSGALITFEGRVDAQ